MASNSPRASQKRKTSSDVVHENEGVRKRQKYQDARHIAAQSVSTSLTSTGELNITSFIKAREFEIDALDKSMRTARQSLSKRAFQQVPRALRRRTASHNAKRVPRRLRARAESDMKMDNTPAVTSKPKTSASKLKLRLHTAELLRRLNQKRLMERRGQKARSTKLTAAGKTDPASHVDLVRIPRVKKNKLAQPVKATVKFKKRQVHKTWLPTHLWHSKRAKMTRPVEPLWRMAIPLTPTEKSYRASHRAAGSRGCIAWDMSYISTIGCLGTESALEKTLHRLGLWDDRYTGAKRQKVKAGKRFYSGWVYESGTKTLAVAPATVIWCAKDLKSDSVQDTKEDSRHDSETCDKQRKRPRLDRRMLLRVHPSAFNQVWEQLLQVAKMQKPQVVIEDLRFEIGSIDVIGPESTEALLKTLEPCDKTDLCGQSWQMLRGLSNPASLPLNAVIAFDALDPRLPPAGQGPRNTQTNVESSTTSHFIVNWPPDQAFRSSGLFSHRARYRACQRPSQRKLNRLRSRQGSGSANSTHREIIPFPVMLLAQRAKQDTSNLQGTWTVLAPWQCVDMIWRSLMARRLSSGTTPRFGGLFEKQQLCMEQSNPWFPGDFPGTAAGKAWDVLQTEQQYGDWVRKAPSRRMAYTSTDLGLNRRGELGRGWACDWDYLHRCGLSQSSQKINTSPTAKCNSKETTRASVQPDSTMSELNFTQLLSEAFTLTVKHQTHPVTSEPPSLITVRISLLAKGSPHRTARIYRLPKYEAESPTSLAQAGTSWPVLKSEPPLAYLNQTPPAAQASPAAIPCSIRSVDVGATDQLRTRWMALIPSRYLAARSTQPRNLGKVKSNHRGLRPQHKTLPLERLRHINVLPKNAPQEVIDAFEPKPLTDAEKQADIDNLQKICLQEQSIWECHVPCPGEEDLIGFVTSGCYNLTEGAGTAVGALWAQRLIARWSEDEQSDSSQLVAEKGANSQKVASQKQYDGIQWKNRLCIVRNSGESIGRLGIWDVCSQ